MATENERRTEKLTATETGTVIGTEIGKVIERAEETEKSQLRKRTDIGRIGNVRLLPVARAGMTADPVRLGTGMDTRLASAAGVHPVGPRLTQIALRRRSQQWILRLLPVCA